MPGPLVDHVVVPVADEADARATAAALEPYDPRRVTVVNVVEKSDGAPDKKPLEQAESIAADAVAAVRERFPDADAEVVYRSDVVEGVLDAAADVDATAVAFRPRGGSRLVQFLAGDTALRLITEADRPVVSLPDTDTDEET